MRQPISAATAERPLRFRGIRVLRVLRAAALTPRMRRITLGGEEIAGFGEGPNLKVLIPPPGLAEPEWPMPGPDGKAIWPAQDRRPAVRTYSLRGFRPEVGEIDIDFVLHGHGVASDWAMRAEPGDLVGIGGPGGRTVTAADWYLLAGDHTALPAIAAILEKLPACARGHAIIEIPDAAEQQGLRTDAAIEITWLHQDHASPAAARNLCEAVRSVSWPSDARVFAWAGCESSSVRAIKAYLRDERRLDRRQYLAIGYWRRGMTETAYHDAYNNDRDQDYFETLREEAREANRARGMVVDRVEASQDAGAHRRR